MANRNGINPNGRDQAARRTLFAALSGLVMVPPAYGGRTVLGAADMCVLEESADGREARPLTGFHKSAGVWTREEGGEVFWKRRLVLWLRAPTGCVLPFYGEDGALLTVDGRPLKTAGVCTLEAVLRGTARFKVGFVVLPKDGPRGPRGAQPSFDKSSSWVVVASFDFPAAPVRSITGCVTDAAELRRTLDSARTTAAPAARTPARREDEIVPGEEVSVPVESIAFKRPNPLSVESDDGSGSSRTSARDQGILLKNGRCMLRGHETDSNRGSSMDVNAEAGADVPPPGMLAPMAPEDESLDRAAKKKAAGEEFATYLYPVGSLFSNPMGDDQLSEHFGILGDFLGIWGDYAMDLPPPPSGAPPAPAVAAAAAATPVAEGTYTAPSPAGDEAPCGNLFGQEFSAVSENVGEGVPSTYEGAPLTYDGATATLFGTQPDTLVSVPGMTPQVVPTTTMLALTGADSLARTPSQSTDLSQQSYP